MQRYRLLVAAILLFFVVACSVDEAADKRSAQLTIWHTYGADSKDEAVLLQAIEAFELKNPDVVVVPTRIPYSQNLPQFINSSQGGEAPDLIRVSDIELGKIGHISVEGLPLLEDLRPHLTPEQRKKFEPQALTAMRYGEPLFAVPSSQSCLSLLYNKALFDAADVAYPDDTWTIDDMLAAAKLLTNGPVTGLGVPLDRSYWFAPFKIGFGGLLFENDKPTLASPGSATAIDWFLDLERKHHVVKSGTNLESMSTQFALSRTAMIIDGPWNLITYIDAGISVGQAVMPIVAKTGNRAEPLFSFFGWAVSKQSGEKVAAVKLALWLTSATVQKEFALHSYAIPTDLSLASETDVASDPLLAGYLRQARHCTPVPTSRAVSMALIQMDIAIEMIHTGAMDSQTGLAAADAELRKVMAR